MSSTLNYDLKNAPPALFDGARWPVLTMLIVYSNNRDRCWPTMKTISEKTGKAIATVTSAKQWLVDHGAVEMVPFDKRVGEETDLAPRRHVYQLTGTIKVDDVKLDYLYDNRSDNGDSRSAGDLSDVSEIEYSKSEISPTEISIDKAQSISRKSRTKSKKKVLKTLAPVASAPVQPSEPQAVINESLKTLVDEPKGVEIHDTLPSNELKSSPLVPAAPPTLPDGWAWRCSSVHGTLAHAVPADKLEKGNTACGASLVNRSPCDAPIGNKPFCLDCQRKAKPKKARDAPKLPATYGDLFVLVRRYAFNGAEGKVIEGKAGKATLALLDNYPNVTTAEFQSFADDWNAKQGKPTFPCGTDSLPTNFGKWKALQVGTPASTASYLDGIPDYGDENPYTSQFKAGSVINSAWQGTIEDLEVKLGKSTFNNRVKGLRLVEVQDGDPKLFIAEAQNEFQQQYILKHLMHSLLKTLEDRARCKVRVEVRIGAKAG